MTSVKNCELLSMAKSFSCWRQNQSRKRKNQFSASILNKLIRLGDVFLNTLTFLSNFPSLLFLPSITTGNIISYLLLLQSHGKNHIKSFYHSLPSSLQSRVEKPLLESYWYSSSPLDAITPALIGFRSSLCLKSSRRS